MKKTPQPYLDDILEAIDEIEAAMAGVTPSEYADRWILRKGVERGIAIISEAARHIPEQLRNTQPQIPWQEIFGIGNFLRHEYRRVSDSAIVAVVKHDLGPLRGAILAIEASLDDRDN